MTTGRRLAVAAIQLNAGTELAANLDQAEALIRAAAKGGAQLVATPENTGFIVRGRERVLERLHPEGAHPGVARLAALARELGLWLLAGSLAVRAEDGRAANRSLLFAPDGRIAARYDKIHMFDVDLAGGESYRESATYAPGGATALADLGAARLGLTICYDLRFPHLYRALAQAGAEILTVPSAFTVPTGRAHWEILLRARAIETGCFVLAPAQTGTHDQGRQTWGHSLIIAPWGEVLADAGTEVGFVSAVLELDQVAEARRQVPSLRHDRPFAAPVPLDAPAAAAAS